MKTKAPALTVMTLSLLTAPLAYAGDDAPVLSASVDLNGDGKPEAISIEHDEAKAQYVLKVGTATVRGPDGGSEPVGFTILDLDSSDKRKEVVAHTGQTDYDKQAHIHAFDGKGLKLLGTVPSITEARGNGIILSDNWQGFWNRRDKFALDAKKAKLTEVPQDLYAVGVEVTVKKTFPLARTRTEKTPVANLAQGSKIQVVAAARTGGSAWMYLVKSSTGLMGWATATDIAENTDVQFAG